MIKGLTDKKIETLLCQCELQEYQLLLLYFVYVYHTGLCYEIFWRLFKTLVFFLFIENVNYSGSY